MKTEDFSANESVKKTTYFVYLSGEVLHPGVYEADPGDRIYDVIEKAGGFLSGAKEDAVNLASKVKDGMHIHIPTALSDSDPKEQKVNVNTADVDALMSLPNIGASKAEAIVRYRKEHGLFVSEEDLLLVPGIGNALLESIRDRITF